MDALDEAVDLYLQLVQGVIDQVRLSEKARAFSASRDLQTSTGCGDFSIRYPRHELFAFYDPRLYPPPPTYPTASLPLLAQHSAEHVP
jgi:hypothetical protein